jgi:hypothetical protein
VKERWAVCLRMSRNSILQESHARSLLLPAASRPKRTSRAVATAEGILHSRRERLCQQRTQGARGSQPAKIALVPNLYERLPARVALSAHTQRAARATKYALGTCEVSLAWREAAGGSRWHNVPAIGIAAKNRDRRVWAQVSWPRAFVEQTQLSIKQFNVNRAVATGGAAQLDRSTRPRAVRWPGASAPRFSAARCVALRER